MKITVYTTSDCQFSKQEKEYLKTNNLVFEEKNLETNKEFLTEMLAVSNNFAGTPVTRVEKDDGSIAILKGFTKEEFDTTFGLVPTPAPTQAAVGPTDNAVPASPAVPVSPSPTPANDTPVPPAVETPSPVGAVPPPVDSTQPPVTTTPSEPIATPDPLKSVMDSLQSKAQDVGSVTPPVETPITPPIEVASAVPANSTDTTNSTTPPAPLPNVPEPDFK